MQSIERGVCERERDGRGVVCERERDGRGVVCVRERGMVEGWCV